LSGQSSASETTDAEQIFAMSPRQEAVVTGDNPIRRVEDDALERHLVAYSFAQQVLTSDAREGLVVGVLGPWGSGKTSFINLARNEFNKAGVPILDFNPWMFSGAQQLVESFFVELAAQLRIRKGLQDIGKNLEEYGEVFSGMAWVPFVGPWIERGRGLTKILSKILQRRKEGIGGRRAKLREALLERGEPIVVVLDDIDRLSTSEIRDVFKLVRLTASFPNIIYVVAFDRGRVEKALGEEGVPGRDYLEKILQVAIDLPSISDHALHQQIVSAINGALAKIENTGSFDADAWSDVYSELIRPLIRNMRDVRRYAAAVHGTVRALGGQIALVDVLGLEAIRVFLPDVFARLHDAIEPLTTTSGSSSRDRDDLQQLKSRIDNLIKDGGAYARVVHDMIERLFPAARRHIGGSHYGDEWKNGWLKERRVAHEDVLRFYLERVTGERLQSFADAEKAWARLQNRDALDKYLRSINQNRLEDVIALLEVYEDQFATEHAVPGITVLLNLLSDLPERQRGMFDMGAGFAVSRVVYRLLRALKDPVAVEAVVRQTLPHLKSLSAKFELIGIVGHREGRGHKLVSETAAREFEKTLRDEVRSAPAVDLAKETEVLRLLLLTKRESESEDRLEIHDDPELTLAILRSARSEARSQSMGSRAVRRYPRLAWDALVEVYGGEAVLRERIQVLKAASGGSADELLQLADKYLAGWRPKDFGDDEN